MLLMLHHIPEPFAAARDTGERHGGFGLAPLPMPAAQHLLVERFQGFCRLLARTGRHTAGDSDAADGD